MDTPGREMSLDEKIAAIAQVCHEANFAWCIVHGDTSAFRWERAPEWQRESAIRGVTVALEGVSAEQQHEAWMADKLAEGWVHGPVKDGAAKTHPCLVAYDALPADQKAKDALFQGVVHALAPALRIAP